MGRHADGHRADEQPLDRRQAAVTDHQQLRTLGLGREDLDRAADDELELDLDPGTLTFGDPARLGELLPGAGEQGVPVAALDPRTGRYVVDRPAESDHQSQWRLPPSGLGDAPTHRTQRAVGTVDPTTTVRRMFCTSIVMLLKLVGGDAASSRSAAAAALDPSWPAVRPHRPRSGGCCPRPPVTDLMTTHLVGITSDAARLQGAAPDSANRDPPPARRGRPDVPRHVARPVEAMPTTALRADAARRMANGAEAVLVTCGDRLLGIVTASDLIRTFSAMPRTNASNCSVALTPR